MSTRAGPWATSSVLFVLAIMISGCTQSTTYKWPTRESAIPDGAVKMTPGTDLSPPVMHSDKWEKPVPMPAPISSAGAEDSPFVVPDGSGIYFVFVGDVSIPPERQLAGGAAGIYYAPRSGTGWGDVKRVRLYKDPRGSLDGCPTYYEGKLWFCSVRNGNYREIDIYTADVNGEKATHVKDAGKHINLEVQVGEMHITSDGKEMYFHNNQLPGKGKEDIFVSRNVNGEWQLATPVDAVNTAESEGWPYVTPDGKELWFNRFYQGTPGVFRCLRSDSSSPWGPPELIISSFAGEPNLDEKGNIIFVHHYYDNGTMIEADLYIAYKK